MAIPKTSEELLTEIAEDPNKFMKKILHRNLYAGFPRIFPFIIETKTSINSRMETILEGETRKAEVKLIEYNPEEN